MSLQAAEAAGITAVSEARRDVRETAVLHMEENAAAHIKKDKVNIQWMQIISGEIYEDSCC